MAQGLTGFSSLSRTSFPRTNFPKKSFRQRPSTAMNAPSATQETLETEAARLLIEIDAVRLAPHQPFTLTSGKKSPVYVDCRRIISFVAVRSRLLELAEQQLRNKQGDNKAPWDLVAGGETAGIPYAAFLAERLGLPMVYLRKQAKGFGRNRLIEGAWETGQRVLLVEDMMTDGGSKVHFIQALRDAELVCEDLFVFFRYGIFGTPEPALATLGVSVTALAAWSDVLDALPEGAFSPAETDQLRHFLADPAAWQEAHP